MLGVTSQALVELELTGKRISLAGAGTSIYPAWQFYLETTPAQIRPVIAQIIEAFHEQIDKPSPYLIAGWGISPQPELDEITPAEWIIAGRDHDPVILAAERAAWLENR